jgi:hypothetical protein
MKRIAILLVIAMAFASCRHRIKGSGNVITEQRSVSSASKIRLEGSYDVELIPGSAVSVKLEGDDNILPYIITRNENGWLVVKSKDHLNFSTKSRLKVYVTTDMLEAIHLSGTGNITGQGKFVGGNEFDVQISGVGSANLEIDAPSVNASISGSGSISLAGATKEVKVDISGVGHYKGMDLMAEDAKVHVSGSGSADVFASTNLDIHVSGVGSVKYKGNAAVSQHVSGSGSVKKTE